MISICFSPALSIIPRSRVPMTNSSCPHIGQELFSSLYMCNFPYYLLLSGICLCLPFFPTIPLVGIIPGCSWTGNLLGYWALSRGINTFI